MPPHRVILVFVKWPDPGRVKTRLAASVGDSEAVAIYRHLVERLIVILDGVPAEEIRILFDPADREADFRNWFESKFSTYAAALTFEAQNSGDLGDRLSGAFQSAFKKEPRTHAVAIGTDCIEIDEDTFSRTWEVLRNGFIDAVFGPATDGGYYLIGLNAMQPALFQEIPWSSEATLAASLDAAESAGLRTFLLDEKSDVDTLADWEAALELIKPC